MPRPRQASIGLSYAARSSSGSAGGGPSPPPRRSRGASQSPRRSRGSSSGGTAVPPARPAPPEESVASPAQLPGLTERPELLTSSSSKSWLPPDLGRGESLEHLLQRLEGAASGEETKVSRLLKKPKGKPTAILRWQRARALLKKSLAIEQNPSAEEAMPPPPLLPPPPPPPPPPCCWSALARMKACGQQLRRCFCAPPRAVVADADGLPLRTRRRLSFFGSVWTWLRGASSSFKPKPALSQPLLGRGEKVATTELEP